MGTFTATSFAARAIGPREGGPTGTGSLDESVRDALRAESAAGRKGAARVSDALNILTLSYAIVGDPLVNAAWFRDSPQVGLQVGLINAEVLALSLGIQQITANAVGRERPFGRTCGTEELEESSPECQSADRYRSFFSGHSASTFAMAAATCVHHIYLPLSGGNSWVPCTSGAAVSTATAVLRIVADKHYATDVFVGVLTGTAIGAGVPLFHYAFGIAPPAGEIADLRFQLLPTPNGLLVNGTW